MANQGNLRIAREISQIQKENNLSISVECRDSDVRTVRALIVGPPGTPYEYGFFEFLVKFDDSYPSTAPKVNAKTTNRGRTRFNPNIYAGGKVCLSILGTWHGEPGEEWSSAQCLESVLLSIQSLMSDNPYENEPGYENNHSEEDKKDQVAYSAKIQHETIRIAVLQKLESLLRIGPDGNILEHDPDAFKSGDEQEAEDESEEPEGKKAETKEKRSKDWEPFHDLQKRRFLWYYESYFSTIENHSKGHAVGERFRNMPFEHSSNSMDGSFRYAELGRRLVRVKEVLKRETEQWAMDGLRAKERESSIAFGLQRQFDQAADFLKQRGIHNVELSLQEGNPFVWILTYFGNQGTNLEGGLWRIRMFLSPRFPEEQPRVQFENKIFHHRVSPDGVLCYCPTRTDEARYHVEAITQALEELSPPYDPRMIVNPAASKLLWGSADDKRKYDRQQRRSASDSTEELM